MDRKEKMKRFIDIHVPVTACNLNCHYCYVADTNKRGGKATAFQYPAEHIGKALSRERMGGICHFNLCGLGETLIPEQITEIVFELLKQGHYIMIVTNGLLSSRFEEFCRFPAEYKKRLGFKFSLHYLELKRTGQLEQFARNVNQVWDAGCSISVEVTPTDELEKDAEALKEYCLSRFGALPHLTIPRKESEKGIPLLSGHTMQEFLKQWGSFSSELLDMKASTWQIKRKEYCYAGAWSGLLNLGSGELYACSCSRASQNIFEDTGRDIDFAAVGRHCKLPHCYNSHVFLTLGTIPQLPMPTYEKVRNRVCQDGREWLGTEMKEFLSCRLDESNPLFTKADKRKNFRVRNRLYWNKAIRKIKRSFGWKQK